MKRKELTADTLDFIKVFDVYREDRFVGTFETAEDAKEGIIENVMDVNKFYRRPDISQAHLCAKYRIVESLALLPNC